jgi:tripartite-type tricarboxylate transporter receptor subunit TctC
MRRRQFVKLAVSAGTSIVAAPSILRGQGVWPDKPVRLIVPFAAGGGTDLVVRPWAEKLQQAFGQQFVVENRGGASGVIGTEAALKSAPDGYTFLAASNTTTVNLPLLRKVSYDPQHLIPIARIGDVVTGFVITTAPGLKTFKEMVEYARKNPEKLSFGSSGPGTGPHLRMEMLQYKAGIKFLHVPYRGGADALTDILAGNIHLMNEPNTLPHVKAGKLILLNINHSARSADFPDIPTLTELGYPGADAPIWFSLWAPKGVSQEIMDRINAKVVEISKTPEMVARLQSVGAAPVIMTQAELIAFRAADTRGMAELIKVAGIKIE